MSIAATTHNALDTAQAGGRRRESTRAAVAFAELIDSFRALDAAQQLPQGAAGARGKGSLRELAGVTETRELAQAPPAAKAQPGPDPTEYMCKQGRQRPASATPERPDDQAPAKSTGHRASLRDTPGSAGPSTGPISTTSTANKSHEHATASTPAHQSPGAPAPTPTSVATTPTLSVQNQTSAGSPRAPTPGAQPTARIGAAQADRLASRAPTMRKAQSPPPPQGSERAQRMLAMQASRGLAGALKNKDGTIQLRLRPTELGSLRVTVRVDQTRVAARIEASSEQARAALEAGAAQLRGTLQSRGLEVHRLDIVHTPPQAEHPPDGRGAPFANDSDEHAEQSDHPSTRTPSHRSPEEPGDDAFFEATSAEPIASGPWRVIEGSVRLDALA